MSLLPHWYLVSFVTIFGLLIGSFLNVVIYRVPAKISLMGRSHCPRCNHLIRAYDNIPVFTWFILRGKCRDCKTQISMRYPFIEALNGLTWGFLAQHFGFTLVLPFLLALASISIALAMIDFDTMTLPHSLVLSAWITVIVGLATLTLNTHSYSSLVRAGLSGLAWGVFYFCLWFFSGGRGLGFGDLKLAPALGLMAGWFSFEASIVGFLGAFIVGGIPAIILLATGIVKKGSRIPYGPMLLFGTWVGIIWGEELANLYLSISGLK